MLLDESSCSPEENLKNELQSPRKDRNKKRNMDNRTETSSTERSSNLFLAVKLGEGLQRAIDDWIKAYNQDKGCALLDLLQFFIQCTGCKGCITQDMTAHMEHTQIIEKITKEFGDASGDYPLIMSGIQWRKFRWNFCLFLKLLVFKCKNSIIYDKYMIETIISFLNALSNSQAIPFRHTATVAAMKLISALVEVKSTLSIELENNKNDYDVECENKATKATQREEMLLSKQYELQDNMKKTNHLLSDMFTSIFIKRLNDTVPAIRSTCIYEIGLWLLKFHKIFLSNYYLKYIGWTLHDKVGNVRLICLQALLPVYGAKELSQKLETFTNKFKGHIIAMTMDENCNVAAHAVKLIIRIHKYHREKLTAEDCKHVCEQVFSSSSIVAQEAGEFLNEYLFKSDEYSEKGLCTKNEKNRTLLIRRLVQFFITSKGQKHGAFLVDSLFERNAMIKDWKSMTDLLLEEPGPLEEPLDHQTSMIEIMVCCIKQAATGEPPVGRFVNRRQPSAKEIERVTNDRIKMTEHFIQMLPKILTKCLADGEKLAKLMLIPQYFSLNIYARSHQENLETLLKLINDIVEHNNETNVLESCAKTYKVLCDNEHYIHSRCVIARDALIESLVKKYKQTTKVFMEASDKKGNKLFAIISVMKKVHIFYNCHDLHIWNDIFITWVKGFLQDKSLPEEVVRHAIASCRIGMMWDIAFLHKNIQFHTPIPIMHNMTSLDNFLHTMKQLLMQSTEVLKEEVFVTICDLVIHFCSKVVEYYGKNSQVYQLDNELKIQLAIFIQDKVFVEDDEYADEAEWEKQLSKRRNFLACYCRLIISNIVNTILAVDVFNKYVTHYANYSYIIEQTIIKIRDINNMSCTQIMFTSLKFLFQELCKKYSGKQVNRQVEMFAQIKELARRFTFFFGMNPVKYRHAIARLHYKGILYTIASSDNQEDQFTPPQEIAFLEILAEFSKKLIKQDKRMIITFLDHHIHASTSATYLKDCEPFIMYLNSLDFS